MAVIHYMGYCLVAVSLIPIESGRVRWILLLLTSLGSLLYGSNDSGNTVETKDEKLNKLMENVGKLLHLAPHMIKNKKIYGSVRTGS